MSEPWKPGTAVSTSARGRHYLATHPCHVCTLARPPHCCVSGKKVALWCAKWFTERRDRNKLFTQDSEAGSPSEASNAGAEKTTARGRFLSPVVAFSFITRAGGRVGGWGGAQAGETLLQVVKVPAENLSRWGCFISSGFVPDVKRLMTDEAQREELTRLFFFFAASVQKNHQHAGVETFFFVKNVFSESIIPA